MRAKERQRKLIQEWIKLTQESIKLEKAEQKLTNKKIDSLRQHMWVDDVFCDAPFTKPLAKSLANIKLVPRAHAHNYITWATRVVRQCFKG